MAKAPLPSMALIDSWQGRYLVRYIVRDEAEWAIDILVDGAPIRDSPFQPGFDAGATNPSKCHVFGDCFHQATEPIPLAPCVVLSVERLKLSCVPVAGVRGRLGGDDHPHREGWL